MPTKTPEPLNLISRPLDLTISGVRMGDDDDDDADNVYGMLMSTASGVVADGSGQRLACICGKTFDSAESFATHIAVCVKSRMTPYKTCTTCGKVLFSNSGYTKHLRLHAGKYKYRCGICRQGFFDQTNLQAHADARHSKVRRYTCPHCYKSFFWKHHLKRHCESCDFAVTKSSDEQVTTTAVTASSTSRAETTVTFSVDSASLATNVEKTAATVLCLWRPAQTSI